MIFIGEIFE